MMTHDEVLKLARFISRYSNFKYEWGRYDCMLFPVTWHDLRHGTRKSENIFLQYKNRYQALKFYKNFVSVTGWLTGNGYKEVEDLQDGDFVVAGIPEWPQVYIALNGILYMMCEDGLRGFSREVVEPKSIWRR